MCRVVLAGITPAGGRCVGQHKEPAELRDPEEGGNGEQSTNTHWTAGTPEEHQQAGNSQLVWPSIWEILVIFNTCHEKSFFFSFRKYLRSRVDTRAVWWRLTRDDGGSLRVNCLSRCSSFARTMSSSCSSTKRRSKKPSVQRYVGRTEEAEELRSFLTSFFWCTLVCVDFFVFHSCRTPSRLCRTKALSWKKSWKTAN